MSETWQQSRLRDDTRIKHGFAFKGEFFTDEPTKDVLVTPGNFAIGGGFQNPRPKYYAGPIEDDYVLSPGDLVVTMTDLSKASDTLGYPALIPSDRKFRYLHNQRVGKVELFNEDRLDKYFLYYLLCSPEYRHSVLATASGTTVKHTSPDRIRDFEYRRPELPEQQAIAEILGALDDKIELNRKMNATLDELARTIFRSWFVDFDPVRANAEGREPFGMDAETAALFPDRFTDSELGPIPEGWKAQRVDEVANINKSSMRARDEWEFLRYIDISSTKAGDILETPLFQKGEEPSRAKRRLSHGDTALSTVRPDRRSYFLALDPPDDLIASTGFAVVSPESVPWSFLHAALTQDSVFDALGQLADGGAYPAVRPGVVGELGVIVPEDARITDAYHVIAGPLFELAAANREESRTLTELRDTLLPELISGRIGVPKAEIA